jgi:hypothetical protein
VTLTVLVHDLLGKAGVGGVDEDNVGRVGDGLPSSDVCDAVDPCRNVSKRSRSVIRERERESSGSEHGSAASSHPQSI